MNQIINFLIACLIGLGGAVLTLIGIFVFDKAVRLIQKKTGQDELTIAFVISFILLIIFFGHILQYNLGWYV